MRYENGELLLARDEEAIEPVNSDELIESMTRHQTAKKIAKTGSRGKGEEEVEEEEENVSVSSHG